MKKIILVLVLIPLSANKSSMEETAEGNAQADIYYGTDLPLFGSTIQERVTMYLSAGDPGMRYWVSGSVT